MDGELHANHQLAHAAKKSQVTERQDVGVLSEARMGLVLSPALVTYHCGGRGEGASQVWGPFSFEKRRLRGTSWALTTQRAGAG